MNPLINSLARNSKFGWYNTFRKHVIMSTSFTNVKLVLILLLQILTNGTKCWINSSCIFALYVLVLAETKNKMSYGVCVI